MAAGKDKKQGKRQEPPYAPKDDVSTLPAVMAENQKTVDARFWTKMARFAANIPFAKEALAGYYCASDPNTPMQAKAILLAALAYFILPTDAVPDLLPFLGFSDDAAVIAIAIAKIRQHLKPEHHAQAERKLEEFRADRPEAA